MCLVCGDVLAPRRTDESAARPSRERRDDDDDGAAAAVAILASTAGASALLNDRLRGGANGGFPGRGGDRLDDDLAGMALPPEALDPQAGPSRARPASRAALDGLRRTVLAPGSAELFDARVCLSEPRRVSDPSWPSRVPSSSGAPLVLNAVPGEFLYGEERGGGGPRCGSARPMARAAAAVVVCSPRTVRGGALSARTLSEIASLRRRRVPFVAYVERGDGVTFVRKALACQRAGETTTTAKDGQHPPETMCVGVVVGNTTGGPGKEIWPYVMQDTKGEALEFGLRVPVVMVRRDDGMRLVGWSSSPRDDEGDIRSDMQTYAPCQICILSKDANSHTCPVCTDSYAPGDTIVRLPLCGHVFHESCALSWLTKHNTCPYCRKELPTDDDDYERERRRRGATAERDETFGAVNDHNFYG
jgi:hypothetical protein